MPIVTNHQTDTLGKNDDTDLLTFTSGELDVAGTIDATNFKVGGAQGTDGQVLTSTGSGVAWEDAGGGGGNANGFPYSRVPTKNINGNSADPAGYWYPSDLVEHRNSGQRYTQNKMYYVPWLAPMGGTISYIGSRITSNSAASGENIYYGIYNSCPSGVSGRTAGTPYQRLGFATFSLNGAGTGNKMAAPTSDGSNSGSAVTVVQGELYYLTFGADLANYSNLYVNTYRRNSFMPFTGHQMTGSYDYSYLSNGLPSSSTTASTSLALTSTPPASLFALYTL